MSDLVAVRSIVVEHAMGLHARSAVDFVRTAQRFKARVRVRNERSEPNQEDWADAESILSILSLEVHQGTRITIRADGPDATKALDALCDLVASNFAKGVSGEHDRHNR